MLTAKEAQVMLGVSLRQIYVLASSGAIAHYRFGKRALRFEEAQILAYKQSCAVTIRVPKEVTVTRVNVSLNGNKSPLEEYFEKARLERVKRKLQRWLQLHALTYITFDHSATPRRLAFMLVLVYLSYYL